MFLRFHINLFILNFEKGDLRVRVRGCAWEGFYECGGERMKIKFWEKEEVSDIICESMKRDLERESPLFWVRSVIYILVDRFDNLLHHVPLDWMGISSYRRVRRLDSRLINAKLVNPYPVYCVRHASLYAHSWPWWHIEETTNVLEVSTLFYFIRSCPVHSIYIEVDFFRSLRSVALASNVKLWRNISVRFGLAGLGVLVVWSSYFIGQTFFCPVGLDGKVHTILLHPVYTCHDLNRLYFLYAIWCPFTSLRVIYDGWRRKVDLLIWPQIDSLPFGRSDFGGLLYERYDFCGFPFERSDFGGLPF